MGRTSPEAESGRGGNLRKLFSLLILCVVMMSPVQADIGREQKVERVTQALGAFQKGGQVWQGRLEEGEDLGTFYLKYPGTLFVDYDRGQDIRVVDGTRIQSGNRLEFIEDPLWILVSGSLGKSTEILMVDLGPDPFYGSQSGVIVADLTTTDARSPKLRLRIYVSAEGTPKLLGWGVSSLSWLRDFHPAALTKDVFSVPKL